VGIMRILIIGAGDTGRHLARMLSGKGNEVIVVDKDKEKCKLVAEEADVYAINKDATDLSLYEEVDLRKLDVMVAATDKDEVNLFVALIAREHGVPRIIVRVKDEKVARLLERVGIERAICVPYVIAGLIQSFIEGKYSLINISPTFSGTYGLVSITLAENDTSIGKTLDDLRLPLASKVIAVFDGERFLDPEEVRELRPGYEVIALVRNDIVEEFIRAFR